MLSDNRLPSIFCLLFTFSTYLYVLHAYVHKLMTLYFPGCFTCPFQIQLTGLSQQLMQMTDSFLCPLSESFAAGVVVFSSWRMLRSHPKDTCQGGNIRRLCGLFSHAHCDIWYLFYPLKFGMSSKPKWGERSTSRLHWLFLRYIFRSDRMNQLLKLLTSSCSIKDTNMTNFILDYLFGGS